MTWKELKEKIDRMSTEQQELPVLAWGEYEPISEADLEICDENMYRNDDWYYSVVESDLTDDEKEDPETILVAKKGTYYLSF